MLNMNRLLHVVKELHHRGYGKLRVIPSVSPSGMSWRCSFLADVDLRDESVIASNWIQDGFRIGEKEYSIDELTDRFEKDHVDFLKKCKGENRIYAEWYSDMLRELVGDDLPYAFSDYFGPTDYWRTSKGTHIRTLPNEKSYYSDH